MAGVQGHEQVIEILAAALRTALDQVQIVRDEDGDAEGTDQVAGPAQRLTIELHPVPPAGVQLGLDQQPPALPDPLGPNHGTPRRRLRCAP